MTGSRAAQSIDLGGTKIEGIVLGLDGAELARRRVATPRHDYRATLSWLNGQRSRPPLAGVCGLPTTQSASRFRKQRTVQPQVLARPLG